MVTPIIPPGFTSVQTPDGVKITNDGKIFQLIAPSDEYLRDGKFNALDKPGEATERRIFPGGSWDRTNDYSAKKRNWVERDASGGIIQSFQTDIASSEVDARLVNEDLVSAESAVLAETNANPLRDPLLQLIRHMKGRDPVVGAVEITLSQLRARVGNTIDVEVRMSRTFNGLAGFNFSASMTGRNCKFVDVVFPPVFALATHNPDPVNGPTLVTVAGVDLAQSIQGAQTNILLATLRVQATGIGPCGIAVEMSQLDDDSGFPVVSVVKDGLVSVS